MVVPSDCFSSHFEACFVVDAANEVEAHVANGCHVGRAVAGAQSHEVVVEDDIEDPMQSVFDMPMGANCGSEAFGGEFCGGQIVASLGAGFAAAVDFGLDHSQHGQAIEAPLAGEAPVGGEPVDRVADGMPADLDAAVVAIGGFMALDACRIGVGEEATDFRAQCWPVVLEAKEIVCAPLANGFGDFKETLSHGR